MQRGNAKPEVFPFSVVPVPWNVYPVKCEAYFSGTKPIPPGSAEKGKNPYFSAISVPLVPADICGDGR